MTEQLKKEIKVPQWLIAVIVPAFITFMIFSTAQIRAQQNTATKVEVMEKQLEKKADKEELSRVYDILNRIENKLDRQIEKQ